MGNELQKAIEPEKTRWGFTKKWGLYSSHIGVRRPDGTLDIYMKRYIFKHPWGTVRIHGIMRSDADLHLHDHPFDFTSVIIRGKGYTEHTPFSVSIVDQEWYVPATVARFFPRFSVIRRRAEQLHKLVLRDGPVWTLVFSGPYRREWGFSTERGWLSRERYQKEFSNENEVSNG